MRSAFTNLGLGISVLALFSGIAAGQGVGIIGTDTPVNYPPVAYPGDVATLAGMALNIQLSGGDANGDPITFGVVSGPANGSLTNFDSATGTAIYSPNPGFFGNDNFVFKTNDGIVDSNLATVSITVARTVTSTGVTSSANPSLAGQPVTFTATVNGAGSITPTGTVTFFDGASALGTGTLNAARQATLATGTLTVGFHALTVKYAGDANFNSSTSAVLIQTVGFADIQPSDLFFAWIEALATAGITGGCSTTPPQYCPNDGVTRAQMAVFLLRGIHGTDYQPPDATGLFVDVPVTHPFVKWIEQLAREGITGGCSTSPPQYCPEGSVTRAQMAVFLLRAKYGSGYQPPAATGLFTDVSVTHLFANWIEQLAREGITGGCSTSPPQYCPENPVTRGQMAVFLVRAFNLPM